MLHRFVPVAHLLLASLNQRARQTGEDGRDLVERVVRNAKRYMSLFSRAIDDLMPQPTVPVRFVHMLF